MRAKRTFKLTRIRHTTALSHNGDTITSSPVQFKQPHKNTYAQRHTTMHSWKPLLQPKSLTYNE